MGANQTKNIRYLNESIIRAHEGKKKVQLIVGGILAAFNLFGIVEVVAGEIDKKNLPVYVVFMFPAILLLCLGIRTGMLIESARRYETVFGGDRDGIITVEELSTQMGKPGYKIFSELEKVFRRGYFQNCSLQQGGHPAVIINDMLYEGSDGVGFLEVKCSNCGGVNRIRNGAAGKCSYCGAPIAGK